jgi:hypothetical protein
MTNLALYVEPSFVVCLSSCRRPGVSSPVNEPCHTVNSPKSVNCKFAHPYEEPDRVGDWTMKLDEANTTPSISKSKKAALQLAGTAPERKAFANLLRQQPVANATQLATAAADGAADLYKARRNLVDRRNEQLANALRLALTLSLNRKKLDEFDQNKFWDDKRPNAGKLLLSCLQFTMRPRNDNERKLLSKYAAAVNWLVLRGYGPDDLARGIMKEGGRSACTDKLAEWRRERKRVSADKGDPTAQAKTRAAGEKQPLPNADAASAEVTSGTTNLPVGFGTGILQKITDRDPPADHDEFWGRILHRGDRISIVEIAPDRPNSPPKALKLAKHQRNKALSVNSSRRKDTEFRQRRILFAEARQTVMASADRRLG